MINKHIELAHIFAIACYERFYCPFHFSFLGFLFFRAAPKSWVLIMGKAWKWDLEELIIYNGPFYLVHHFYTKPDDVGFQFLTSECRRYPKPTVVHIGLSKFYPLLIKNDAKRGTKSANINGHIWPIKCRRVKRPVLDILQLKKTRFTSLD